MTNATCGPVAASDLMDAGLSSRTAQLYARTATRIELALTSAGSSLRTCDAEQLRVATAAWIDRAPYARHVVLEALPHLWRHLGRTDPPALDEAVGRRTSVPRSKKYSPLPDPTAAALEEAAVAFGGAQGLMVLVALHTSLSEAQMVTLRWEDLDIDEARWWVRTPDRGRIPVDLTSRLCAHLATARQHRGWAFPDRTGSAHAGAHALTNRVRSVAELAGLASINPERVRRTVPPAEPATGSLLHPSAKRRAAIRQDASGVDVEQLMALGLARKTAYMYSRMLDRAAVILGQLGTDLASCTKLDLVKVAEQFPNSTSTRARLRAALRRGWEVTERDPIPSLLAIRVPPKPRAHCLALAGDDAARLEQVAWDRDDRHGLAILLGLYAGLRRFEIATLHWEDFRSDHDGVIHWVVVRGKADLVAEVPIHPVLAVALSERPNRSGWVFPGRYPGRCVSPNTIWSWVREAAAAAGLGPVSTHRLRHTALAEANDRSGDLRTVQELARHRRPETTAGYTRVSRQRLTDVAGMIDYGRKADRAFQPDPADLLPGIGYRQLVEIVEGPRKAEAWIRLGQVLERAGWTFAPSEGPILGWSWPEHPELTAAAGVARATTFILIRQSDDPDIAESWDLDSPEQLVALAHAIAADITVPAGFQLGPWIERPFVEFLRGERPEILDGFRSSGSASG